MRKILPWAAVSALVSLPCFANAAVAGTAPPQVITWDNIKQLPDLFTGSWQMWEAARGAPAAGIPSKTNAGPIGLRAQTFPLTERAQQLLITQPIGGTPMDIGTDCGTEGMPGVMTSAAMPLKFMASPGLISVWVESAGVLRFIRMDGRQPDPDPDPTYLGSSVGHWEGDTLVIETNGLVADDKLEIGDKPVGPNDPPGTQPGFQRAVAVSPGPNLHIVERIRLTGKDSMQITRTLYDDSLYTKPLVSVSNYKRFLSRNAEPQEWFCSKNRDTLDRKTGETLDNVQEH